MTTILDSVRAWLAGREAVLTYGQICHQFPGLGSDWYKIFDLDYHRLRREFINEFGFSIPCKEAVDEVARYSPIVEIGAGSGYWAKLISLQPNTEIVARDNLSGAYGFKHATFFPIKNVDAVRAVTASTLVQSGSNKPAIFCSWPSLNETWLLESARVMLRDQVLIVIREECCATEETWDYIESAFTKLNEIDLPQWPGVHDFMQTWKKL